MDDFSFGIAMGQKRRADAASGAAIGLVGVLGKQLDTMQDLRNEIATLELRLAVKTAHAEGLNAQVRGYFTAHPDSPEREDTGERYKDGDIKTVRRMRYQHVFDATMRAAGVDEPTKYRAD